VADHRLGDVDHAGVGDRRGDPVLERDRARDPVACLADAEQCDAIGIDASRVSA
jgi:hypothetical protein